MVPDDAPAEEGSEEESEPLSPATPPPPAGGVLRYATDRWVAAWLGGDVLADVANYAADVREDVWAALAQRARDPAALARAFGFDAPALEPVVDPSDLLPRYFWYREESLACHGHAAVTEDKRTLEDADDDVVEVDDDDADEPVPTTELPDDTVDITADVVKKAGKKRVTVVRQNDTEASDLDALINSEKLASQDLRVDTFASALRDMQFRLQRHGVLADPQSFIGKGEEKYDKADSLFDDTEDNYMTMLDYRDAADSDRLFADTVDVEKELANSDDERGSDAEPDMEAMYMNMEHMFVMDDVSEEAEEDEDDEAEEAFLTPAFDPSLKQPLIYNPRAWRHLNKRYRFPQVVELFFRVLEYVMSSKRLKHIQTHMYNLYGEVNQAKQRVDLSPKGYPEASTILEYCIHGTYVYFASAYLNASPKFLRYLKIPRKHHLDLTDLCRGEAGVIVKYVIDKHICKYVESTYTEAYYEQMTWLFILDYLHKALNETEDHFVQELFRFASTHFTASYRDTRVSEPNMCRTSPCGGDVEVHASLSPSGFATLPDQPQSVLPTSSAATRSQQLVHQLFVNSPLGKPDIVPIVVDDDEDDESAPPAEQPGVVIGTDEWRAFFADQAVSTYVFVLKQMVQYRTKLLREMIDNEEGMWRALLEEDPSDVRARILRVATVCLREWFGAEVEAQIAELIPAFEDPVSAASPPPATDAAAERTPIIDYIRSVAKGGDTAPSIQPDDPPEVSEAGQKRGRENSGDDEEPEKKKRLRILIMDILQTHHNKAVDLLQASPYRLPLAFGIVVQCGPEAEQTAPTTTHVLVMSLNRMLGFQNVELELDHVDPELPEGCRLDELKSQKYTCVNTFLDAVTSVSKRLTIEGRSRSLVYAGFDVKVKAYSLMCFPLGFPLVRVNAAKLTKDDFVSSGSATVKGRVSLLDFLTLHLWAQAFGPLDRVHQCLDLSSVFQDVYSNLKCQSIWWKCIQSGGNSQKEWKASIDRYTLTQLSYLKAWSGHVRRVLNQSFVVPYSHFTLT